MEKMISKFPILIGCEFIHNDHTPVVAVYQLKKYHQIHLLIFMQLLYNGCTKAVEGFFGEEPIGGCR